MAARTWNRLFVNVRIDRPRLVVGVVGAGDAYQEPPLLVLPALLGGGRQDEGDAGHLSQPMINSAEV